MNKYAGFSDRFNGVIKFLGQDLSVNRYFTLPEGRHAYYEKGKLYYEDSKVGVPAFRVWIGQWPREGATIDEAIKLIQASRESIEAGNGTAPHYKKQHKPWFGQRQYNSVS